MRYWIEFHDYSVKEYEADDFQDAYDEILALGLKVKDWDMFSFRSPPREPEPKQEIKYLPM